MALGLSRRVERGTMGILNVGPIIHWMNADRAACGAPPGAFVSPYPHVVTCPECLVALKVDLLERRLAAYRASVLFGLAPRPDRGKPR